MKKLLLPLLFLVAAAASAQVTPTWDLWTSSWVRWDGGSPAALGGSGVTPYSGTPVLGDFIYFDGTNWVSLVKPVDGDYSLRFTSSIPSYTAAAGGAPSNATYITQTANGTLSAEQALGALTTGLLLSTTTTGVLSIKAANTCTNQFARTDTASGVWTCASVGTSDITASAVTLAKIANAAANSKLLGSGASGSGAAYTELTLGTGLSFTSTTLNVTGLKYRASLTIENPTSAESIPFFYTSQAATITKVRVVVKGSTPSVTSNVGYGTSIASLTSVTTAPSAVTNATTGVDSTLNNTAIPADGYLVFTSSAQSGTVNWMNVTVEYTIP